ncbi:MAG: c-type cytochrome [Myxococcota bacterium]
MLGSGVAIHASSERALQRVVAIPPEALDLAVAPEAVGRERGRHLATAVAQCHFCHGSDLAGAELADDPLIGRLWASNLTAGRGGIGRHYERRDWVRAIRHGLAPDGRSLLLMPSAHLAALSDEDLASLIGWLEALPPVDAERPRRRVGWLARLAIATGRAPDLFAAREAGSGQAPERSVRAEATARYGRYLVDVGGCRVCHRDDLSGGLHPLSCPGSRRLRSPTGRGARRLESRGLRAGHARGNTSRRRADRSRVHALARLRRTERPRDRGDLDLSAVARRRRGRALASAMR